MIDKGFRKGLRHFTELRNLKERESSKLYQVLLQIQEEHVNNHTFFAKKRNERLQYVALAYDDWVEDYKKFGMVSGALLHCKALWNCLGAPFVAINGRHNVGFVLTFSMGFIANETTESLEWVLEMFKSIFHVSPSTFAIDQSPSTTAAIRKVFPVFYISLSDWHLNKNQLANAIQWCREIGRGYWITELIDLHVPRARSAVEAFEEWRKDLEDKYIKPFLSAANPRFPRWYRSLCHENPSMVSTCYKNLFIHLRFFFQGSRYTKAFNRSYQKLILKENSFFSC